MSLSRAELLAMTQHSEHLPIACVEGWTTWQDWTGVRLADLAALAGITADGDPEVLVESLQEGGAFAQATLASNQIFDDDSLLALQVNGDRPLARPRLPRADHRPRPTRRPQHQMGQAHDLQPGVTVKRVSR